MIQHAYQVTVSEKVPLMTARHTSTKSQTNFGAVVRAAQAGATEKAPLTTGSNANIKSQQNFGALARATRGLHAVPSQLADDVGGDDLALRGPDPAPPRGRAGQPTLEPPPGNGPSSGNSPTPPQLPAIGPPPLSPMEQLGFFRSDDLEGPVRFKEVPEWAKWPEGNFKQAPEELGGEWWKLTPFTSPQPWTSLQRPFVPEAEVLPDGYARLFGPRPQSNDYDNYMKFKVAEVQWEDALERFKGIGLPEGIDPVALAASTEVMLEWGLGEPFFYEDVNGWHAKFPDSANPDFEINPTTLLMAPHVTVARYQLGLIRLGTIPETLHPFIPPVVLARLEDALVT